MNGVVLRRRRFAVRENAHSSMGRDCFAAEINRAVSALHMAEGPSQTGVALMRHMIVKPLRRHAIEFAAAVYVAVLQLPQVVAMANPVGAEQRLAALRDGA
jgi:hypothetical protein